MPRLHSIASFCLALCLSLPLAAEEPEAFTILGQDPAPRSAAAVRSWQVAARFDVLQAAPARLGLPLAVGEIRAAELIEIERRGDGYTWRGRMTEGEGSVTLTVQGSVLAGLIEADHAVYEIVPGKKGISSLVLLDTDRFPECATSAEHAIAGVSPDPGGTAAPPRDSADRIDVMVLYTASARTAAGGTASIQAIAQAAVDAANTAYANSQITQRLRLVYTGEVAHDEATAGSYNDHLYWITADAGVAGLRDAYRADMVGLLVEDGAACGVGWLMSSVGPSFASSAYSVTTYSCAVGNLSFAHELGHNMGAHHDPANASAGAYPYSYGHFVNGSFRTVMSYSSECPSGCQRVSRFSNPAVSYLGQPTGIANARDNHQTLNNTAAVVANFRQEVQPSDLFTITPCRVFDTRSGSSVLSGLVRTFDITGVCGIPANAEAVVANVTVVGPTGSGYLTLYPANIPKPGTSVITFQAGAIRANNLVLGLPAGGSGTLAAEALVSGGGSVHVILDATGYFAVPAADEVP